MDKHNYTDELEDLLQLPKLVALLLPLLLQQLLEEEVLQEFLETFETHRAMNTANDKYSKQGDGQITLNEFYDYYSNVSASVDNDEYFQLMITNAWNLDNRSYKKAQRMEY